MNALLPLFVGLLACTTTETPAPEAAAEQAATEDTGGPSPSSPGKLAETIRQELADDPAEPEAAKAQEGEPAAEAAEPAEASAPTQAPMAAPGKKAPPPCEGISGELARAVGGDLSGLEVDDAGRVHVTYEFTNVPEQLPEGFVHETSAMGHGQGWCPPALLCDLAAVPSISRVRTVRRASPKLD